MLSESVVRIIFGVIFLTVVSIGSYFRHKAHKQNDQFNRMRHEGPVTFFILRICGFSIWVICFLFLVQPSLFTSLRFGANVWVQVTGIVLAITALPMGISVFRNLGRNITDTVETRAHHELVTSGIYRFIRHPLYTTGFLFFFGLGLIAGLWPVLSLSVVVLVTLYVRTFAEEDHLIAEFGDRYKQYITATGKFFPKLF
jgi:protein-S-isoprenylcysteine O-methyltransferase Ste14